MTKTVRMAMVGLGWWGQKMLSVLETARDEITVVRAVEPNVDAVKDLCRDKSLPLGADYAEALTDPAVEAVILATPHALHEAQIEAAVGAGKHIFCEKPLSLTKAGAERAVALCRDAGLQLGMGHERRFEPPIARLLQLADDGALGRIQQIEANFSHDKFLTLDRGNWRLKGDQAPAGGMTATGIHLLDLSVRLLGAAESVHCICETLSSDLPQGDTVAAFARFSGGGTSYVSASLANPFFSRFAVFGSDGWIDIRDKAHVEAPDGWIVTSAMKGGSINVEDAPPAEPVKDNLVAFARAVRGEAAYPITPDHLVNNIALLEAVFASAKSGRTERVA
ncbi:MAG: Gfo/Idh/MocA family oxidoreductase [Roseitalea sp.]|jgi:predicted dehydrogenase|nr:Gfo/Idh/MocA family oxidoreductase [Roseitalea sp.]MBO6722103.1 Gfo/Idh/MocA family oxidoreductase [Roseitalea sp.]MBO6741723.1 Gfo/Idh/MocA family oxidoreductase [Roseitalea sp.]